VGQFGVWKTFPTINPATEEVITYVQEADKPDVDKAGSSLNMTKSWFSCPLHSHQKISKH
jgi:acyl-CoA reductase-like NAD-dependent aldehyde dehydrogenase